MGASSSFTTGSGLQDVRNTAVTELGQAYKSNINLTLVDPGALAVGGELGAFGIRAANDAAELVASMAADVISGSAVENERSRAFAGQAANMVSNSAQMAVNVVTAAGKKVLEFASTEGDRNRAFAGQAVQAIIDTQENALASVQGSFDGALGAVGQTVDRAFSIVGGSFTALEAGHAASLDAIADNSIVNMQFLNAQASRVADIAGSTLNGITNFVSDLLNKSDARTADIITGISEQSSANVLALGEATRSDASKSLDKVVMTAGVAIVVLGAVALWMRGS